MVHIANWTSAVIEQGHDVVVATGTYLEEDK